MNSVAVYARYSSDNQRESSIEDQIRICREHAEREGWIISKVYCDHAISGASMILRPGIQSLMQDAMSGKYNLVMSEALDRVSRDQEEIAGIFKRLKFSNTDMFTLSEGQITELHIGLKGTMNAIHLKDLGEKVHRGLRGRIEAGKSGGGNSFGYDVVKRYDGNGEPIRGDRKINPDKAAIVQRIFKSYATGKSPKAIALELNREGIVGPTGKAWGQSTINGNRRRGTGILNNEIYIGRMVWNKVKYLKNPDTGKRIARVNDEAEWIVKELSEFRIIDQELWDSVKARQKALDKKGGHLCKKNRPKYLLSNLLKCGSCGGGYSMISQKHVGCSNARNKGTCDNRLTMKRESLEQAVLNALQNHLMEPELCKAFCEEYTRHLNDLRKNKNASINRYKKELARIGRDEKKAIQAIMDGFANETLKIHMQELEDRKKEVQEILSHSTEDTVIFHPNMAQLYHKSIQSLVGSLTNEEQRSEAAEVLRGLLDKIVLTPAPDKSRLCVDLHGDLAGILAISTQTDISRIERHLSWYQPKQQVTLDSSEPESARPSGQVALVAGVGFEPTTFRL